MSEIPPFAYEQFVACRRDLAALASRWPSVTCSEFLFDGERGALATLSSERTRTALFGNWVFRAGKGGFQFLRTRKPAALLSPFQRLAAEIDLPRDAVILLLHEGKTGVVMVSAKLNLVVKLRYGEKGLQEWRREIAAISEIRKSKVARHVPPVLEHGVTPSGCAWIVTPLAPNHHPILSNLFRGDRKFLSCRWRKFLNARIFPVLETVCKRSGIEEIKGSDYLASVGSKLIAEDLRTEGLLRKVERMYSRSIGEAPVLISRVHGDLYARHVHRTGGRWWLLDWGESDRREMFLEILDQHIRRPASYSNDSRNFWSWLNRGGDLHGEFGANIALFTSWIREWTGIEIRPEALRFQILVYLLKRIQDGSVASSGSDSVNIAARTGGAFCSDVSNPESILADLNLSPE